MYNGDMRRKSALDNPKKRDIMSYIINLNGQVVGLTHDYYKSCTKVKFAFCICEESMNASRDYNLVNAHDGKISNAKKYEKMFEFSLEPPFGEEINPDEFFIKYRAEPSQTWVEAWGEEDR